MLRYENLWIVDIFNFDAIHYIILYFYSSIYQLPVSEWDKKGEKLEWKKIKIIN